MISMDFFFSHLVAAVSILVILIIFFTNYGQYQSVQSTAKHPPGSTGWPIVGETLQLDSFRRKGHPEKFTHDRMKKYSADVFSTSLYGDRMAVFCGASGNKFLFSNENKLVASWWPRSFKKIFMTDSSLSHTSMVEAAKRSRGLIAGFLKIDALQNYIPIMNSVARQHVEQEWAPHKQVVVYDLSRKYTFQLACRLFLSIQDTKNVDHLADRFANVIAGMTAVPVNFPATPFNRAIKDATFIRKALLEVIKERKKELQLEKKDHGTTGRECDLLSIMLLSSDENGKFMNEVVIADKIIGLLIGGFDTASTTITFIVNYLADHPFVYNQVYSEQMEIAKSKGPRDLLNWEDIQKMKYSWNVACEAMRLAPPSQGAFKEALTDLCWVYYPKGMEGILDCEFNT